MGLFGKKNFKRDTYYRVSFAQQEYLAGPESIENCVILAIGMEGMNLKGDIEHSKNPVDQSPVTTFYTQEGVKFWVEYHLAQNGQHIDMLYIEPSMDATVDEKKIEDVVNRFLRLVYSESQLMGSIPERHIGSRKDDWPGITLRTVRQ